jgi:hypothetical protein
MQTTSPLESIPVPLSPTVPAEPIPAAPPDAQALPADSLPASQPALSLRTYREPPLLKDKHVYCVVSRLLTNNLYVSGGYERPHLAAHPTDMVVVIDNIRYCIHFRSLKGGFPEYLSDENLMRLAQDSAEKLLMRRYASGDK